MLEYYENSFLYTSVEMYKLGVAPFHQYAKAIHQLMSNKSNPLLQSTYIRSISATCEMIERFTQSYDKPEFGIGTVSIDGKLVKVCQTTAIDKTFCHLLHFKKDYSKKQPKLLIVAPLSGHHATLLRGTVQDSLPYFDVYITDWVNANQVPIGAGKFDLDDFINYTIEFIEFIGEDVNIMAVCQPTVPVLAAVSIMASTRHSIVPNTMILIGGPVDTRKHPTAVDQFAACRNMNWFETHMITRVPFNYPGAWRRVYPGFTQLSGFISMNLQRHIGEHIKLFEHLIQGDGENADKQEKFYNEYLSVLDITAEFYLQTINTVFKEHALPRGKMESLGRKIDLASIEKTKLLILEGELDDISGIGQTKAAINLCHNIPARNKHYALQKGVGHYGLFNGHKFREHELPLIKKFIEMSK